MNFESLANNYGTPLYVFDCDQIKKRAAYFKQVFPKMELCYAIKANSFVIKEIIDDIERVEVCSNGEYEICKMLNIPNEKIVLSGVYKNQEEFEAIFQSDVNIGRYTIESLHQFELLLELSSKYKKKIQILPRLTSNNQFGVTEEEIEHIINTKNEYMDFVGIEYFSGTQKHSMKRIQKEFEIIKNLIEKIEKNGTVSIQEIEYGTGFPIYYFQGDSFDEVAFFQEFNSLMQEYFHDKKIVLEIGRSLVANAGYYFTKVVDFKENKTGKYVILDGGNNHLVYYGQTMAMKIPFYEILNKDNSGEELVNLCGSLCTVNDILVKQLNVPKLEINDIFVFKNAGAYSVTEGISLFLSRDLPKVVLISNQKERVVRDHVNTYTINRPVYGGE